MNIFEPIKLGAHTVPGIWRYILPDDVFYFQVDPETQSSCFDCPQVKKFGFHPSVRCCAFIPRVPNFLLGLALATESTRAMVESYIQDGYALPEGSQLSPVQLLESLRQISPEAKTGPLLVCPFLDLNSKHCRLYAFRNGVCSTFFCIHDRGEEGLIFWEHLQDLVSQIETALSQWALTQAGFDLDAYFRRFNSLSETLELCTEKGNKAWSLEARKFLFQEWFGREIELYQKCAALVIEHKDQLYAIACRQKLFQTTAYDDAARALLLKSFPAHLVSETLPEGEPVSIGSIWYSVQLAHRNLQLSRLTANAKAEFEQ
ncbi:MAG: hypothetical protein NTX25_14235 [Proteobacteria bacterium]|nr:hypothetical protein [Pseudomonadota bacterium]